MDDLLLELHQKTNEWFAETPQRTIAQFLHDTIVEIVERELGMTAGAYARLEYLQEIERRYEILRKSME